MIFLSVVEAFNVKEVFFFFFGKNVDTYCKRVMTAILFLSLIMSKTFLVIFVLFINLILVGGRLLGLLSTRYVNKRSVSGLIFFSLYPPFWLVYTLGNTWHRFFGCLKMDITMFLLLH